MAADKPAGLQGSTFRLWPLTHLPQFMTKNAFAALVGAMCTLSLCPSVLFGQNLTGTSLLITGTGTVNTLVSGTASVGLLEVTGTADFQNNTWLFGISGTNPGVSFTYNDGTSGTNSSFSQTATRPLMSWAWQRLTASGTSTTAAMKLDDSNRLILTGTAISNPPQLVMDPNGMVSLNGSNFLTRIMADSIYLSSTISLVSSNGNLGVGTANPQAKLDVAGTVNVGGNANPQAAQLQVSSTNSLMVAQIIKGVSSQTASLQEWQNSEGGVLARISNTGAFQFLNGSTVIGSIDRNGGFMFTGGAPSSFRIGGDVNTYTLTPNVRKLARVVGPGFGDPNRSVTILGYDNGYGYADVWIGGVANGSAYAASKLHFATSYADESVNWSGIIDRMTIDNNGSVVVGGFNNSAIGFVVKGGSSQIGDLQQWQNCGGGILGKVAANGNFAIGDIDPIAKLDVNGNTNVRGGIIVTGSARLQGSLIVTGTMDSASNTIIASGTNQLVLIPQQGDLSMGNFTVGAKPQ